jgi:hypothetical protein
MKMCAMRPAARSVCVTKPELEEESFMASG